MILSGFDVVSRFQRAILFVVCAVERLHFVVDGSGDDAKLVVWRAEHRIRKPE